MSERRRFLKMVAAGPAGAFLLPLFSETGKGTLAAEVDCCANALGKLPENIVYTEAQQGVWKGKAGGHVPIVQAEKADGKVKLTVKTNHGMSQKHYIVRHTVVTDCGKVLGAKTFHWDDEPLSSYEFELSGDCKQVFVTSYCNLHDLWLAKTKLEV